jgi:hypothetical protein
MCNAPPGSAHVAVLKPTELAYALKDNHAPFFPPVKRIFAFAPRINGPAVTTTGDVCTERAVFSTRVLAVLPLELQCIKLIVSILAFAHFIFRGFISQFLCTDEHRLELFIPSPIAVVEPGLEHVTVLVLVEFARRQSQAPFFPPEKFINPPGTSDVGATLTVAAEENKVIA